MAGQTNTKTKSKFLKHQMEGGHRTAREGATQADMLDSMPDHLQDLDNTTQCEES